MGMRRHERDQHVTVAQLKVREALHQLQEEHDLTDIEMLQALHEHAQGVLKYMLRFERHGDYDYPAGLAKDDSE